MATREELILKVEADTKEALKNLKAVEKEAEKLDSEEAVIGVRLATDVMKKESDAVLDRLRKMEAGVDIPIHIDSAGLNTINSTLDDIDKRGAMKKVAGDTADAGQAMSVFANFTGNAAQEIPGISGAFGPLNMAISQFVEYSTEGSIGIKALASSAVPLLGMAAAIGAATIVIQRLKKGSEEAAAQAKDVAEEVKGMTDALLDAKEAGTGAAEALTDLAKTEIVDILTKAGAKAPKLVKALNEMGISAEDLIGSFDGSNTALQDAISLLDDYQTALESVIPAGGDVDDAIRLMAATHGEAVNEMKDHIDAAYLLDAALTDEQKSTIAAATAARTLNGYLGDSVTKSDAAAKAQQELADAAMEAAAGFDASATILDAYGTAVDKVNAKSGVDFATMAEKTVGSFDDIKAALKETQSLGKRPLIPTTVKDLKGLTKEQGNVIDATKGMRDAIQDELAFALQQAGGDFTALRDKAEFFRGEVADQFPGLFKGLGLSSDEAKGKTNELLTALGLMPKDIETQIKVTQDEIALKKLEIFSAAIAGLDKTTQAKIVAAVEANSPQEAWQLAADEIEKQGAIDLPAEVAAPDHAKLDTWIRQRENDSIGIPVHLVIPNQAANLFEQRVAGMGRAAPAAAASSSVTNVTVHMPAGSSGPDVVRAMTRHQRRNGALL